MMTSRSDSSKMNSSISTISLLSLILIASGAKEPKEDKATVKKLIAADISMKTKDDLLNAPCPRDNYCFFIGNGTERHVKNNKDEVECSEDFCQRVNFKPLDAKCSKFEVYMGIISTNEEALNPNLTQWMGIGFKFRSNQMYDAYGVYCREHSSALYYGYIRTKKDVDFGDNGEKIWKASKPSLIQDPIDSEKQDGLFTCSFELPRTFDGIKDEPIDIASGNWNLLIASGIKRTPGRNLEPSPDTNDGLDAVKYDMHTARGPNKDKYKPAEVGGWGICPPAAKESGANQPAINLRFFWTNLILLLTHLMISLT